MSKLSDKLNNMAPLTWTERLVGYLVGLAVIYSMSAIASYWRPDSGWRTAIPMVLFVPLFLWYWRTRSKPTS